jgi:aspartate/methionine/tyrosine aminotransferase
VPPAPFKLEAFLAEFERVRGLNDIGSSCVQALTVSELFGLAGESLNLNEARLDYVGTEALRAAVAGSYYGGEVSPENISITNGAGEAVSLVLRALLERGDEALVCFPAYQSLYEMVRAAGAAVSFYHYPERAGFAPDWGQVRRSLSGTRPPKVLVLNAPHNPTGHVIDEETLGQLLEEAVAAGTVVVIDEVFRGIWLNQTKPVRSGIILNPNTVVIGSLSKVYGLSGLRIGWVAGPPELTRRMGAWQHYVSTPPSSLAQTLGEIAIKHHRALLERARRLVQANLSTALGWLRDNQGAFGWVEPQGGVVMLLKLKLELASERFARDLAEKERVLLVPCAHCFGMPEGYLRLGLGGDPALFRRGLDRVTRYTNLHSPPH